MDVPKDVQDKLAQFQTLQQQIQLFGLQKQQLMAQSNDLDNALTELGKADKDAKVYKSAGVLLVESDKETCEKSITEDKEVNETRLKSLEKQEKKLAEKYESAGKELQSMLGGQGAG